MTTTVVAPVVPGPRLPDVGHADMWAVVESARAGDREAFGALFAAYHPKVLGFLWSRLRSLPVAEDLAQETFTRAFQSIGRVEYQGREYSAVLITIARNLIMDHYKSGWYKRQIVTDEPNVARVHPDRLRPGTVAAPPEAAPGADFEVTRSAMAAAVRVAVGRLTKEQRRVIELRYLAGLSVSETAQAIGTSEGAVKALAYRATQALVRDPELEAYR